MRKKKEIIRIAQIMGKWVGGGVEAAVMNYYRNIDKEKIQFDFIFDDDSKDIPYNEIKELGGKVILIPPYQKIFKYSKELKKVLKEENYKIVHSHINTLSVFSLRAAKKAGVPVRIAHSHSTTSKKEWKKNLLKQMLRPFSKKYATHYFACSEMAGTWMFGQKELDNIYVLNNAIDIDKFKYNKEVRNKKREELKIKENIKVIGHMGRFVSVKNHEFIIDVFNKVHEENKNTMLLLAGQGPLLEEIKQKVKDLKLTKCVKFLGQRDDANELYQAFDSFIFPSLYEGFGLVAIEAQASGLPCLASTEVPGITRVSENMEFLELDDTIETWKNTILDQFKLERKSNIKNIKQAGFDIKTEVKKLEEKYLELSK